MTTRPDGRDHETLEWFLRLRSAPDDRRLRRAFETWLAGDPARAAAFRRVERAWALTGEVPAAHADRWMGPAANGNRRPTRRRVLAIAGGAAAASVAALAAPSVWVRVRADHRTAVGERSPVTLADGTRVDLDTGTALSVDFTPARRAVALLEGRAFFAVAPDTARPFTVAAGPVSVTAVGTGFDVRLDPDQVAVSVTEGVVSVATGASAAPRAERIAAGERLAIDITRQTAVRAAIDPQAATDWRRGLLSVDGASVASVVEELRRYHPGAILLRDDALAERRVTGVFDLNDPAGALRTLVGPYAGRVWRLTPLVLVVDLA
ncbi:DUF4880 domain-containing protein [Azospirillum sp. RWY-5-1]|uniref:DUF4880 domain-containing protein n=1 Tax=Azospirillum oleiclasticum TaxID=2735135 RepID=A0ABX2TGJ2_9PROT|nr:DUF4880 domain-containing protein [Azospirillum oleiclasticum]NYZ23474.1 DUF4880 domain-containing protein [Azospirillum oleiclasticum]